MSIPLYFCCTTDIFLASFDWKLLISGIPFDFLLFFCPLSPRVEIQWLSRNFSHLQEYVLWILFILQAWLCDFVMRRSHSLNCSYYSSPRHFFKSPMPLEPACSYRSRRFILLRGQPSYLVKYKHPLLHLHKMLGNDWTSRLFSLGTSAKLCYLKLLEACFGSKPLLRVRLS